MRSSSLSSALLAALLTQVPAVCQPRPERKKPVLVTVEEIRRRMPPGVRYLPDLSYREGNPAWKLDLALPEERSATPRPAVVFVHGGGWTSGDKRTGVWARLPLEYASHGYVAISVNYRFATEARLPACVEDVKCAVRWLRAHAKEYNVDPQRVGAFGISAGAHLVSMLGLAGSQAGLEGDGPYQDQPSTVQAVCPVATPADFLHWGASRQGRQGPSRMFGANPEEAAARARQLSPITYANAGAPPFLVLHGTADQTVPPVQGERLVKALRDAGARNVTYMMIDGAGHRIYTQHLPVTSGAVRGFFDSTIGPPPTR